MSMIAELKNELVVRPPVLKPLPDSDFVWDFSKGADHSTLICGEPVVRIKAGDATSSPGRTIGIQKKNPRRNTIDYQDPIDKIIKRAEGTLEMKGLYQVFRDPDVVSVEPQFPCRYRDRNGVQRTAYWDARVTYSDGVKILKDFKPAAVAIRKDHARTVNDIFMQMPATVADGAAMITDRDLPAWAVANGRLTHTVLCDGHWVMLHEMQAAASNLTELVTLEQFCLPYGGIGRTFRTAVYLIAKRKLWHRPGLIDAATAVGPMRRREVASV